MQNRMVVCAGLVLASTGCNEAQRSDRTAGLPVMEIRATDEYELGSSIAVIGASDAPGHALHLVSDAVLLSSGKVALAQESSQSIRYYGPDGTFIREVGRTGGGPGEFRRLRSLHVLASDTVIAWDPVPGRMTVLDSAGSLVSTLDLRNAPDPHETRRQVDSSPLDLYSVSPDFFVAAHPERRRNPRGLTRASLVLAFLNRDGEYVANLGGFQGTEYQDGVATPFGYRFFAAGLNGYVYTGDGREASLIAYNATGDADHRVALPITRGQITPEQRVVILNRFLNTRVSASDRPLIRNILERSPAVDSFPAFTDLKRTHGGTLWLRLHALPDEPRHWLIVDPEKTTAATLALPHNVDVLDALADRVLTATSDSLGREVLRVYTYARPQPGM